MSTHPIEQSAVVTSSSRRQRVRYATGTALGAGLVLLVIGGPAFAADECGPAATGQVECTAAGNPYTGGITYTPAVDLTLATDADTQVTGSIAISGGGAVAVSQAGAVAVAADAANGLNLTGTTVTLDNTGTISTSGASMPDGFDDDGNLIPGASATAVLVSATAGAAVITNSGVISTTGERAAGIDVTAATGVTVNSSGSIKTAGANAPGVRITSAGGVDGAIANVVTTGDSSGGIDVNAGGPVNLTVGTVRSAGTAVQATASTGDLSVRVEDAKTSQPT